MKYGYAFQKQGGPMSWRNGPPVQARAADAKSLGSLGGATLEGSVFGDKTLVLPKPGAPEVMPMGAALGDIKAPSYIRSPAGQARTYVPTTSMKRSMSGMGDCGCGCGGGGGCGGGKLSIKFSDSMDDLFMWGSLALGALTLWSLFKKP
jgi:hypothetical protein